MPHYNFVYECCTKELTLAAALVVVSSAAAASAAEFISVQQPLLRVVFRADFKVVEFTKVDLRQLFLELAQHLVVVAAAKTKFSSLI